ncbi:MAG: ABC transporter permease [Eubacteriales bacterium]|nr:ABC transporter permease [Eubacteriales bacterium]MDY3332526.1 methionine ABC transporter permease [Gallibacter sp.]
MTEMILSETWVTIYMTLISTAIAYLLGLPMGIILAVTANDGIKPNRFINGVLGVIVNIIRSIPFLILIIAIQPFSKLVVGSMMGNNATIVGLVVAAAPFVARLVETSIKEIDPGVIEAAQSMGATRWQIIRKVMLVEAKPSIMLGSVVAVITLLGYTAMAGLIGGGGLGTIALNYGLYRFDPQTMWIAIAVLVLVVQLFQVVGMKIAKRADNRNN